MGWREAVRGGTLLKMSRSRQTEEQAAEALSQARAAQREIAWLTKQVKRQRRMIRGLCEIVREKLGLSEEDLAAAIARVQDDDEQKPKPAELCPKCGRALQENYDFCIYCETPIERRERM
jgi:hypothetical protein